MTLLSFFVARGRAITLTAPDRNYELKTKSQLFIEFPLFVSVNENSMNVGPCHHGMARPRVADGGTASNIGYPEL